MGSGSVLPSALCQAGQVWPRLAGGMSNTQVKAAKKKQLSGVGRLCGDL